MLPEVYPILNIIWDVIKNWWWAILPIIFWRPFLFLWLWWRRERWAAKLKMVLLEIKLPKEVLKPLKAMDQVFAGLWGNIYIPPDWWEKWIDGEFQPDASFEIVSLGGEVHFFIKIPAAIRNAVESTIYSQYPDAEITIVDDYTKSVPPDVPNHNWELWGADYEIIKEDVYPIKTYARFFEERPEVAKEEKRIDPYAPLLEGMARLGPGEQLWVQIVVAPITNDENNYVERGKKIVNGLLKRPEKKKLKPIVEEVAEGIVFGKKEEAKKEEMLWPELMLSPGEREIVSGIENKIGQYAFVSFIRFVYLAKREVFFKPQRSIPFGFFSQFSTANLNALKPSGKTITKIHKSWLLPLNLLIPRRLYVRKNALFRNYIRRIPPIPKTGGWVPVGAKSSTLFVLSAEELATLFHFPGRAVAPAPSVPRVEAKRGGAPPTLPAE